jgi:hypothetical protein
VVHPLRRRRRAERLPQPLVGNHAPEELSEVLVGECAPGLEYLVGKSPAVLSCWQVVLFLDLALGEDLQPLHLYLEHPTVLVGAALDVHVLRPVQALEELLGETPHKGVDGAGLVYELHREVGRTTAVGSHGRVGG